MDSYTAPASALQRGLWFVDRWHSGPSPYTVPWVFEFDGPVEADLLEHALATIVRRHDVLRTTFSLGDDGPCQTVHDSMDISLSRAGGPVESVLAGLAGQRFDLATGPLLRAVLVDDASLVLMIHHIVWDGWSAGVFERELAELYTAACEGRSPELPNLTMQYADYAAQPVEDEDEQLDYWCEQLRDAPAHLDLPADRPRPATQTYAGDTVGFGLPAGTAIRVQELASAQDATPFMVQLAAFAALVNRYTNVSDLVIGTPVTVRGTPELAELIGYFVNVLPLRVRVDRERTFRQLVDQVRDISFDSYAHLDVAFDLIVDQLGLERSAQRAPLVQVLFGAHEEAEAPLRFGPRTATRRVPPNGTSKFDLTLSTFNGHELRGEVEYSTDLFDVDTIARLIDHWRRLLDDVLGEPDRPLWQVQLEHQDTTVVEPRPAACLHTMFEAVADRWPGRPALTFAGTTITYAELDRRANRLAHALLARGARRGDRIGLLLGRTDAIVVAVLAVLKAGAAYVPVDPASPADRAAFVFADTDVRLVVTDTQTEGPWPRFDLADHDSDHDDVPAHRPQVPAAPQDLAYLIFTSGSTGKPKGVAVAHEHVARLIASATPHFGLAETDVWTLFHSFSFDVSVFEIWGALLHGARLLVVPYLTSRSPDAFADLLATEQVTSLSLTPSALRQLEQSLATRPRPLPRLRRVFLAGEALDPAAVRRWFALRPAPAAMLCNLYGTTETTVHATTLDLTDPAGFDRSLVGTGMPHLATAVLDDWLQPCPIGAPGELYLAGGSVADGYWGRPGLTARRFVPGPDGGRWYRTGDLVRRDADGGLEYLGRRDNQVKIRGFRIELGEIEHAIAAHPLVGGCAVTVYQPASEDRRLAAYIVSTGTPPSYPELRAFLGNSLPDHMIPASLTVLGTLPMTVNGKVDRAALPDPGADSAGSASTYAAPSTEEERLLVRAWGDVLGLPDIGVHDNFFHLGGDSIRAVHLAGKLCDDGWAFPLRELFATPTPAALAPLLRPMDPPAEVSAPFAGLSEQDIAALPPDVVDAYPMVSMQLGMVYHQELSGDAGGYHNVNSYLIGGVLDEAAMHAAVSDVMSRHPVLRTTFDMFRYQQPMQLVHVDAPVPVQTADLRANSSEQQRDAMHAMFDELVAIRFDLATAPLFVVNALRLADDEFLLTLAEHHAILDGWSFTSLVTEILERHDQLRDDPDTPLRPAPAATFRDFVAVERTAMESAESAAFWHHLLADADGAVLSGLTHSSAAAQEIPRTVERVLTNGSAQLNQVAAAADAAVKAVGLAAHAIAMRQITGRSRFTTGLAVNGRLEEPGATEVYGLFVNTVPLPVDLADLGDGLELVRAMHRAETELMPHRRVPLAQLVRYMASTRLDAHFGFLRFHELGRSSIVDDARIGSEPIMRYEPTNFTLSVALIQDPTSDRVLLAVDHLRSVVPDELADAYAAAFAAALAGLADPVPAI